MKIGNVEFVLTAANQADDSVLLTGLHGIGKTEIVINWAKQNDIFLKVLYLSNQETGDLIGCPYNKEVDGAMIEDWSVPVWLHELNEAAKAGKKTALFLDELARSPQDVRQAALQLVLDKKIHQHELPSTNGQKTFIVAADNPDSGDYQVDALDPALLDRFIDIPVEIDPTAWIKWAKKNKINPVVIAFIVNNPKKLHFVPKEGTDDRICATPRSWAKLSNFVNKFDEIPREIHYNIVRGKIGNALALQFLDFYKNYVNMVDINDIEDITNELLNKNITKLETIGDAIKDLTKDISVMQKTELCEALVNKYIETDAKTAYPMMGMLYSLEVEILVGFLKKYSADENAKFLKIAEYDLELNNKALFIRLTKNL